MKHGVSPLGQMQGICKSLCICMQMFPVDLFYYYVLLLSIQIFSSGEKSLIACWKEVYPSNSQALPPLALSQIRNM